MVAHLHLPLPSTLRKHRQIWVGRRTVRLTLAVLSMWWACPGHSWSTTANWESQESAFLISCGNIIIAGCYLDSSQKERLIRISSASHLKGDGILAVRQWAPQKYQYLQELNLPMEPTSPRPMILLSPLYSLVSAEPGFSKEPLGTLPVSENLTGGLPECLIQLPQHNVQNDSVHLTL